MTGRLQRYLPALAIGLALTLTLADTADAALRTAATPSRAM